MSMLKKIFLILLSIVNTILLLILILISVKIRPEIKITVFYHLIAVVVIYLIGIAEYYLQMSILRNKFKDEIDIKKLEISRGIIKLVLFIVGPIIVPMISIMFYFYFTGRIFSGFLIMMIMTGILGITIIKILKLQAKI